MFSSFFEELNSEMDTSNGSVQVDEVIYVPVA